MTAHESGLPPEKEKQMQNVQRRISVGVATLAVVVGGFAPAAYASGAKVTVDQPVVSFVGEPANYVTFTATCTGHSDPIAAFTTVRCEVDSTQVVIGSSDLSEVTTAGSASAAVWYGGAVLPVTVCAYATAVYNNVAGPPETASAAPDCRTFDASAAETATYVGVFADPVGPLHPVTVERTVDDRTARCTNGGAALPNNKTAITAVATAPKARQIELTCELRRRGVPVATAHGNCAAPACAAAYLAYVTSETVASAAPLDLCVQMAATYPTGVTATTPWACDRLNAG